MTSLLDLLLAPIIGPLKGFVFIIEQIHAYVQRELYDESRLQEKLIELRMNYERQLIDQEEYRTAEQELLARLREVRKRQEELLEEASEEMGRLERETYGGMQVEILGDDTDG